MSDLTKARELEQLSFTEALMKLNSEEREKVDAANADMARRGVGQPAARLAVASKFRIDKFQALIDARIEIRKELARSFPEMASGAELNALLKQVVEMATRAAAPLGPNAPAGPMAALAPRRPALRRCRGLPAVDGPGCGLVRARRRRGGSATLRDPNKDGP